MILVMKLYYIRNVSWSYYKLKGVRLPAWWMHSWKARSPLFLSHRTRWFGRGCHCKPGSHHLTQLHVVTSDMLWPDAKKDKQRWGGGSEKRDFFFFFTVLQFLLLMKLFVFSHGHTVYELILQSIYFISGTLAHPTALSFFANWFFISHFVLLHTHLLQQLLQLSVFSCQSGQHVCILVSCISWPPHIPMTGKWLKTAESGGWSQSL